MIFAIGTLWFWLLLLVATIFVIISTESRWGGTGATMTMLITLVLLYFFGAKQIIDSVFTFMSERPSIALSFIFIYFGAGVLWSISKWYLHVQKNKEEALSEIEKGYDRYISTSVDVTNNKGKIISWMCYWPFSLLWTVLNDPMRKVFEQLFKQTRRIFESMSEKAKKEVEEARKKLKK